MRFFTLNILALCAALSAAAGKPFTYTDPETGITLNYEWIGDNEVQTAAAPKIALCEEPVEYNDIFNREIKYECTQSSDAVGPNYEQNRQEVIIPSIVYDDDKQGTVVRIGEFSFADKGFYSNNISKVTLPPTVREIGKGAFYGCAKLKTLDLGGENSQLKTIGDAAFYRCQELEELVIPNSVDSIGNAAFHYCAKLKKLTLGENVKTIGDCAFYWCRELTSLNIPDSVTSLGDYCFYYSDKLKGESVHFGSSLAHIGAGCFVWGQFEVTLPDSMKSIGDHAFDFQDLKHTITDIYCEAVLPPDIFKDTFGEKNLNYNQAANGHWIYDCVCLHVPVGSYQLYRDHEFWSQFSCIIEDIVDSALPLSDVVSYAFLVPKDVVNLEKDIIGRDRSAESDADAAKDWKWELASPEENLNNGEKIIELDENGNVTALNFGQVIAIAKRNDGNTVNKSGDFINGKFEPVDDTTVACVIVFVCPTITVVYDNEVPMGAKLLANRAANASENTISALTDANASFEHRVVYNSLPKIQIDTPVNIQITKLERGEAEADGILLNLDETYNDGLSQNVTFSSEYIVPVDPITNNRVIVVSTAQNSNWTTDITNVELTDKISVTVHGDNITINGAEPQSVVNIVNVKGQTVYSGTNKSISMNERGIYIATVEDATFKINIR